MHFAMRTDRVDVKKLLYNLVGVHDFGLTLTVIVVCGRVALLLIRDFVLREKLSMGMLSLGLKKKNELWRNFLFSSFVFYKH